MKFNGEIIIHFATSSKTIFWSVKYTLISQPLLSSLLLLLLLSLSLLFSFYLKLTTDQIFLEQKITIL